jgi:hypothetical protein
MKVYPLHPENEKVIGKYVIYQLIRENSGAINRSLHKGGGRCL